ncbi:MAG: efflux RND transporter periplasmic adaptor subunit [Armatimonadetes bacterium]|nr:efflux RND transporter periplasmic adaptor subunit [Armatimonadota bacterium]
MNQKVGYGIGIVALIGAGYFIWGRAGSTASDLQYKYEKSEKGELVRSISATGVLIPLTTVDIRSKAGGKVEEILVDEGDEVAAGQLLAKIDPEDTRATVDQAQADLQSAQARAAQAGYTLTLEQKNRRNAVKDAENALEIARIRLARAETTANTQPSLTSSSLASARADLATQEQAMLNLKNVEIPRLRADTKAALDRANSDFNNAQSELARQEDLYKQDYISKSTLERARAALVTARASLESAQQDAKTLERDIESKIKQQEARLRQAEASVQTALANKTRDANTTNDFEEAKRNYRQAQLNLEQANQELLNVDIRSMDRRSAAASTVRSKVALNNAQIQLDSTIVNSPRDGVITKKYLEAGTIIPPGASAFSQGTAILQLSDTTRMFVECSVDEADIAEVKLDQAVRVTLEAFPGRKLKGKVTRINPAAETNQNITAIRVRVELTKEKGISLCPGMNATCEFLTLEKKDVIIVPQQAIKREGDKTYVLVKTNDKPKRVDVKIGEQGNEGVEILSGLEVGVEVVTAEINLAQMREIQARMQEVQQGGGLAGGQQGGRTQSRASGGGMGMSGGGGSGGGSRGR